MLTVIYVIGALAVGFLIGVTTETFIDAEQVKSLRDRISELETEKQDLIDGKVEVIEIVDNRKQDDNVYHDYFRPF